MTVALSRLRPTGMSPTQRGAIEIEIVEGPRTTGLLATAARRDGLE